MSARKFKPSAVDRALVQVFPRWGLRRLQTRAAAHALMRHYEAAELGRRTENWRRTAGDANATIGARAKVLRELVRDLVRNDPWSARAVKLIGQNIVGWGIVPRPHAAGERAIKNARAVWKEWAETTACDFDGLMNFYGLQRLAAETIAQSGAVLVRRRPRPSSERLPLPVQLQILEPDFLDTMRGHQGGLAQGHYIVQGVEFNAEGKRVAYWLYEEHPGSNIITRPPSLRSKRVPASEILHVYRVDRPGQVSGVTWGAPVILKTKDFDEYDDATLLKQKIAACFAAFVSDMDGTGTPPQVGEEHDSDPLIETIEPGMVANLPIGRQVTFGNPPTTNDHPSYSKTQLRAIAAGWGVTYEQLTGDYSDANFASSRMARLEFNNNLHDWRYHMMIPQLCDGVWNWAMQAALIAGRVDERPSASWTPPPFPMIEPDREGKAAILKVRGGVQTLFDMIREQGYDPAEHLAEIAEGNEALDALGIILDSDPRTTTQVGQPRTPQKGGGQRQQQQQKQQPARAGARVGERPPTTDDPPER